MRMAEQEIEMTDESEPRANPAEGRAKRFGAKRLCAKRFGAKRRGATS
jgi:hypothetical protein